MTIQNISQEFGYRNLDLLKQKMLILMNTQTILKSSLTKIYFYRPLKDEMTNDKGEKLDGHMMKNIQHVQKPVKNLT